MLYGNAATNPKDPPPVVTGYESIDDPVERGSRICGGYRHDGEGDPVPCQFSEEFGVTIHKFQLAQRTCLCGEIKIAEPEKLPGNLFFGHGHRTFRPVKKTDN